MNTAVIAEIGLGGAHKITSPNVKIDITPSRKTTNYAFTLFSSDRHLLA
jgi:hypothetical protein